MSPGFVSYNKVNYMTTNAKHLAKFFASFLLGLVKFSNLQNIGLCKYGIMMATASGKMWGSMSSLCNFVSAVVLMCAKKQMVGVYAKAIIALVTNKESFWDFSNVKRIRKAMSKKLLSVVSASSSSGSITMRIGATFPAPAV